MNERVEQSELPLLAIETSQRSGSVALLTTDGSTDEILFSCGGREADLLLPSIDELLSRHGLRPSDLAAVAVSTGPGGFTGLRIAVATVKGIAEITGCRVVGVPSALVVAEAIRGRLAGEDRVVVLSAAKDSSCWTTVLTPTDDGWSELSPPRLAVVDPPDSGLLDQCGDAFILCDEHVPSGFVDAVQGVARLIEAPTLSAAVCARVARKRLTRGDDVDPLDLAPIYPREPEAVRLWRSRNR